MRIATILITMAIILTGSFVAKASNRSPTDYRYKVIYVLDGDTFAATDGNVQFRVRIAAMDAPEKGQAYAKLATYRLKSLVLNKQVTIIPVGRGFDRYGRVLGKVIRAGEDIALNMISDGLATYYRPTCQDYPAAKDKYNYEPEIYIAAENKARQTKKNLWSYKHIILPCRARRLH